MNQRIKVGLRIRPMVHGEIIKGYNHCKKGVKFV